MASRTRPARTAVLAALLGVIAIVGAAAAALNLLGGDGGTTDLVLPAMYRDRDLAVVDRLVQPAEQRADRMARAWLAQHPVRDDAAFESYALRTVGAPPTGAAQVRELGELHRLGAHRSASGIAASTWLEQHGKKDIWKVYAKQTRQLEPAGAAARVKALYKQTYKMAVALQTTGKDRFARPSPYQADPTLHAVNQAANAGTTKFSYPSKHALIATAEATVLGHFDAHRAPELGWMADEIAYSRLYAGGHYPSDITAGAYLGRLLADYELGARAAA